MDQLQCAADQRIAQATEPALGTYRQGLDMDADRLDQHQFAEL